MRERERAERKRERQQQRGVNHRGQIAEGERERKSDRLGGTAGETASETAGLGFQVGFGFGFAANGLMLIWGRVCSVGDGREATYEIGRRLDRAARPLRAPSQTPCVQCRSCLECPLTRCCRDVCACVSFRDQQSVNSHPPIRHGLLSLTCLQ